MSLFAVTTVVDRCENYRQENVYLTLQQYKDTSTTTGASPIVDKQALHIQVCGICPMSVLCQHSFALNNIVYKILKNLLDLFKFASINIYIYIY